MKKLFLFLFSLAMLLTACGESKPEVKDFSKFKNMEYADFLIEYDNDAQFIHYVYYVAPVDENIYAVFEGELDMTTFESHLKENSKLIRLEAPLEIFIENIPETSTIEDFITNLNHDENTEIICEALEGAGTAYYVNDFYIKLTFDDKDDSTENLCLDISLTPDEKLITHTSYTWLYWN